MSKKVKTVDELDDEAERRMEKELEKKKAIATLISESVRREFTNTCENEFGVKPDFTEPAMHWVMNGWIAAQREREWLSPEELRMVKIHKTANEKRRKTMEENRLKAREA
jgi:hypothetical protein